MVVQSSRAQHTAAQGGAKAQITWFRHAQGGRRQLPSVSTYRSVARFDDDPNYSLGTWDVEVRFVKPPGYERPSPAIVSFLSEEAPNQLLHAGSRFELTEGPKVVARGEVLPRAPRKSRTQQ
ncbi:MAG TPA: hypothetical protein VGC96_03805 [Candidatus Elarobacter sp.]|jgi:hypothetical protein